jgi:peptide/nickel transport system ATP-binding protein
MTELLKVQALKTWFDTPEGAVRAVDGIDFSVRKGETLALVGESGSGKSITALTLLKLIPAPAGRIVGGHVWLGGQDLVATAERDMRRVRGRRLAMIFQEPQSSLNPVLTVGAQIMEAIVAPSLAHGPRLGPIGEALPKGLDANALRLRSLELLRAVGMADPERRLDEYPHQLSGGMKQRVMIAMALAAEPDILIADEPTTALDVTIQAQILELLKDLQRRTGMAIVLITHDLGIVAGMADRVAVMYAGQIVELAPRAGFYREPLHPYAKKLFRSLPSRLKRGSALEVIQGAVPRLNQEFTGCRFAPRCEFAWDRCRAEAPQMLDQAGRSVRCHLYDRKEDVGQPPLSLRERVGGEGTIAEEGLTTLTPSLSRREREPLLEVSELKVHFPIHRGVLRRVVGQVKAVDGVSFQIKRGCTLALVGESGCGKTTVGKGLLQLIRPTAGRVHFGGHDLTALAQRALRPLRREFQVIFQDPASSLNPRMLVGEIVAEGMQAQGIGRTRAERDARVARLLEHVGLPADAARRYPHEFSGGQRQRISIARALALDPKLIVCDEPTSALDVSVQAQILNLLKQLQDEHALAYLFITHNISVVEYLAHDVAVMYLGRIVERGTVDEILTTPKHPYTQALLAAVPTLEPAPTSVAPRLQGDIPSPAHPPSGCHFHPRCPQAMDACRRDYPGTTSLTAMHAVHCHLYTGK